MNRISYRVVIGEGVLISSSSAVNVDPQNPSLTTRVRPQDEC
jgi:hypothetical protein